MPTLTSHTFRCAYRWGQVVTWVCVKGSYFFFISWCLSSVSFPGHRNGLESVRGVSLLKCMLLLTDKQRITVQNSCTCPFRCHASVCTVQHCVRAVHTLQTDLQLVHVPLLPNLNLQWESKPPHTTKHSEPWVKEAATKEIYTDLRTELYSHSLSRQVSCDSSTVEHDWDDF